ncbi:hypothetical protein BN2497_797 [Janthinobacterium sp. CG23_2]|nr:hypothetical protein BN2497_797 [Janthinobacterium sp. CG23_2]CUU26796.1 hypothetical protein BN3177_797 [Janthinobacterium sp. CG23_2]
MTGIMANVGGAWLTAMSRPPVTIQTKPIKRQISPFHRIVRDVDVAGGENDSATASSERCAAFTIKPKLAIMS